MNLTKTELGKPAKSARKAGPKPMASPELRSALLKACELLEGWVNWKCPRKHREEHLSKIASLREPASDPDGQPRQMISPQLRAASVMGTELLVWVDPKKKKPWTDITVICWSDADGYFSGWWNAREKHWVDCASGSEISPPLAWAQPKGPRP
jgi:hypothetical protein